MSKRISFALGTFSPERAKEHMKKYISEKDLTYEKMASECGLDRRTIAAIAKGGNRAYNEATFFRISKYTGIAVSYWKGLTDEPITPEQERVAIAERRRFELLMSVVEKRQQDEAAKRFEGLRSLFALCGYQYEPMEDTTDVPQIIHRLGIGEQWYAFTEQELDRLLARINKVIAFTCYELQTEMAP